jgi:hypothetical protein
MEAVQTVPWFLDSGPDSELSPNDDATSIRPIHQPWRAYWPPKTGSILDAWLRSEFPEVLSWRFDASHPHDRPWRCWTRSARAKKEQHLVTVPIHAEELIGDKENGKFIVNRTSMSICGKVAPADKAPP